MNREGIIQYIDYEFNKRNHSTLFQTIKNKHIDIYRNIIQQTSYLDDKCTFNERLYNILNNIINRPYCKICSNNVKFISFNKGYSLYCSTKCMSNDPEIKKKRSNTYKEKTGYDNPSKNPEVVNKIKDTFNLKYGVNNASQVKEFQDKKKKTNKEKYGTEYTFQSDVVKDKIKESINNKYGSDNISKTNYFKEKFKESSLRNFGVDHPMKSNEVLLKLQKTMLERFGFVCNLNLPEVKLQAIKKNLEVKENKSKNFFNEFSNIIFIKRISKGRYLLKCEKCNNEIEVYHQYASIKKKFSITDKLCPICFPSEKTSSLSENEIKKILIDLLGSEKVITNSRSIISPLELDIYIPSKNLAIEYNGLFWHSEQNNKGENYHINKTELCNKKNIQLIHIFEDEWLFNKEIVISRLKYILGISKSEKVFARKCNIKEINSNEKNNFLNEFHIQGQDNSKIKLGAFYKDELISVMTFSKGNISKGSRSKEGVWELNRFCSSSKYIIAGIASKLLKYFRTNYSWKEIFSYADRRWSNGGLYKYLGFELDKATRPNYWYVKNNKRIHRFNLRKKNNEPKNIPEWKLRLDEGFYRIWDCGSLKFRLYNTYGELNV